jgi:hypothetical protein
MPFTAGSWGALAEVCGPSAWRSSRLWSLAPMISGEVDASPAKLKKLAMIAYGLRSSMAQSISAALLRLAS